MYNPLVLHNQKHIFTYKTKINLNTYHRHLFQIFIYLKQVTEDKTIENQVIITYNLIAVELKKSIVFTGIIFIYNIEFSLFFL